MEHLFFSNQFDKVSLPHSRGTDHQDIALDMPHPIIAIPSLGHLRELDPIEMGTDLGGQDLFGPLPDG